MPKEKRSKSTSRDKRQRLQNLNNKVSEFLALPDDTRKQLWTETDNQDLQYLIQELEIYQAKLEIQNGELVEMMERLNNEKVLYQTLFESSPLATFHTDHNGIIQRYNPAAEKLFDLGRFELLRKLSLYSIFDRSSGQQLQQAMSGIATASDSDSSSDNLLETQALKLNSNNSREVEVQISNSAAHQPPELIVIARDITWETKIRAREKTFYDLVNHFDGIVFICSAEGRVLTYNKSFLHFFQLTRETADDNIKSLLPKEVWQRIETFVKSPRMAQHDAEQYLQIRREGEGEIHYFHCNIFSVQKMHHERNCVGVLLSDSSSIVARENELKLALQVFNQGNQALMITDGSSIIRYVNAAFEKITGFQCAEVLGHTPKLLSSGRHQKRFYESFWAALNRDGKWEGEIWNKRKHGDDYPQWLNVTRYPPAPEPPSFYIATFMDISAQKQDERRIRHLAYYDSLTDALNRNALKETLNSIEQNSHSVTLFFVDLDDFKRINDVYGHEVGDTLLQQLVLRCKNIIRDSDKIFRIGGDEFLVMLENINKETEVRKATELRNIGRKPYSINSQEIHSSVSIGVVRYPDDGNTFSTLMKEADLALYKAKERGRDCFQFYVPDLMEDMVSRSSVETGIITALRENQFHLYFQAQYECLTGEMVAAEALLRTSCTGLRDKTIDKIISIAEASGKIKSITRFVLTEIITASKLFNRNNQVKTRFAFNLSAADLLDAAQFEYLITRLQQNLAVAKILEVEITERTLMEQPDLMRQRLKSLKELGVTIAIDDFGTGYSSLAYLGQFDIDILKIDKSFVKGIGVDKKLEAICHSVISLAKALNLKCLAEGVETEQQRQWLAAAHCDYIQGFLVSRPVPLEELM